MHERTWPWATIAYIFNYCIRCRSFVGSFRCLLLLLPLLIDKPSIQRTGCWCFQLRVSLYFHIRCSTALHITSLTCLFCTWHLHYLTFLLLYISILAISLPAISYLTFLLLDISTLVALLAFTCHFLYLTKKLLDKAGDPCYSMDAVLSQKFLVHTQIPRIPRTCMILPR